MRHLNETFAASLASGATTLCLCWRLVRRDSETFGATDHDRMIQFDGVSFEPTSGLAAASFESTNGLAPGKAGAQGALDADFITEADLSAGLWDGARVDVWRVDWMTPDNRVRIWSGRMSEVVRSGENFSVELVSLKADLERLIGRIYSRDCDAEVGDSRCKFDLSAEGYTGEGVVESVLTNRRFRASGLGAFAGQWFADGVLLWTSGDNAGVATRVSSQGAGASSEIELTAAARFDVAIGDTFSITAGCDKSFSTCGVKFANRNNFRGFPHLLGDDAVLAGPASDRVNDGGKR